MTGIVGTMYAMYLPRERGEMAEPKRVAYSQPNGPVTVELLKRIKGTA
jgi:hypothetical protein